MTAIAETKTYSQKVEEALQLDFDLLKRLSVELDLASAEVECVRNADDPLIVAHSGRMSEALHAAHQSLTRALIVIHVYGGIQAADVAPHGALRQQILQERAEAAQAALVDETDPNNDSGAQG